MSESPEGEGKQREMGERLSARRWLSEGFLCSGKCCDTAKHRLGAEWEGPVGSQEVPGRGLAGTFVPFGT